MLGSSIAIVALLSTGCSDPAQFRPAKGVADLPSVSEAYRVTAPSPGCEVIGVVVEAKSIDGIAITAAKHGGTQFRVTSDFSTTDVRAHHFVAEIYRCP